MSGTDSSVLEVAVAGDSAILEFPNVVVRGDSAIYALSLKALDAEGALVFEGSQALTVKPGTNSPAAPTLSYMAPDAAVAKILLSPAPVSLDWAGADPADASCLNRGVLEAAHTTQQLTVSGTNDVGAEVAGVRVGWTSRDTSVATVDAFGVVHSRCSNKATWIVARTFTDRADSVLVTVTAPPFALLMSPDSVDVPRDDSLALTAHFVDETGNDVNATNVAWQSSDTSRASVTGDGVVYAKASGRVLVTARSGNRQTIAVVRVVRPHAARVEITPATDSLAVGQRSALLAVAYVRFGRPIPDASGFTWASTNSGVAAVSSFGAVAGIAAGATGVVVSLDGVADTAGILIVNATTGGVTGRVVDAATGAPVVGASVSAASNPNAPVRTGADGRFTLAGLPAGDDIAITASSYSPATQYNLRIVPAKIVELGEIPLALSGSSGTLQGSVVNSLNDAPVAGATVKLFANIEPRSSDPSSGVSTPAAVATTVTDGAGTFAFVDVPSGTYTIAVGASGFALARVITASFANGARVSRVVLSPTFGGAGLRAVLTWGDCQANPSVPCDLDAHLSGPVVSGDGGRFHVAFFQRAYSAAGVTVAKLDNDAQSGIGPETVTLTPSAAGVYKFYVHDATTGYDSTSTRLTSQSHARVDVYSGTTLVATFYPPRGGLGTVWQVFEFDGTNLIGVNQMIRVQDFTKVGADF
jgi:uncharacterized protein YjdB